MDGQKVVRWKLNRRNGLGVSLQSRGPDRPPDLHPPPEPTKFCPTSILAPEASPRSPVSKDAPPSPQRSSKRLPQKRKSWNRSMNSQQPFFWVALFDCLGKYSEDVI